jgi:hypothetical protein
MYYNELLAASTNKSNTAWSIISNEIATKIEENFTPLELKLGNKTVPLTKAAEVFNDYFLNTVHGVINSQLNFDPAIGLLMEAFPDGFPEIINIPITDVEVKCTMFSMKNKNSSGYDGITNKILNLSADYISKPPL